MVKPMFKKFVSNFLKSGKNCIVMVSYGFGIPYYGIYTKDLEVIYSLE